MILYCLKIMNTWVRFVLEYSKTIVPALLLLLVSMSLMVSSTVYVASAYSGSEYTQSFEAGFIGPLRLVSVTYDVDDGYLNIYLLFNASAPLINEHGYDFVRYIYMRIDADNNPFTGDKYFGSEAYYVLSFSSVNYSYVFNEELYYPNGTLVVRRSAAEYVSVQPGSPYINISIPLAYLNISDNKPFAITYLYEQSGIIDYLSDNNTHRVFSEIRLPQRTITVDGDPEDWVKITPLAADPRDPYNTVYQDSNITAFYMARDQNNLYFRFDFGDRYDQTRYSSVGRSSIIDIGLDINNDGANEYTVSFYRGSNQVRVYNLTERSSRLYREPHISAEESDSGIIEYSVPLEYVGLSGEPVDPAITVTFTYTRFYIGYSVVTSYYNSYFPEARYTSDRMVYSTNRIFHPSDIYYYRGGKTESGELSLNTFNATMSATFTGETGYVFAEVKGDPTGKARGKHLEDFIILRIDNSSLIEDKTNILYRIDGRALENSGVDKEKLRPYIYDWDVREYLPAGIFVNAPNFNLIMFSIDPESYPDTRYLIIGFFEEKEPTTGSGSTATTTGTITVTNTVTKTETSTVTETTGEPAPTTTTTITATVTRTEPAETTITVTETITGPPTTLTSTVTQTKTITETAAPLTKTSTTTMTEISTRTETVTEKSTASYDSTLLYLLITIIIALIIAVVVIALRRH